MTVRTCASAAIAAAAVLGIGAMSAADVVPFVGLPAQSTENLGNFSGTAEYNWIADDMGQLVITITNDSMPDLGGYLTGFMFRIVSIDPGASASLTATPDYPSFENATGDAPPYGAGFQGGAALGGDWTGGGSPNGGIPSGATGIFTFAVAASDAEFLSARDFINGGSFPYGFVVRFKGFDNGGSDKVPAGATICCTGDLDCDGDIDGRDLGFLLGQWGPNLGGTGDLNGDGVVNGADVGLLLGNWGFCPSAN
ncbi:MAG: hypothetical protein KDA22_16405 [Phycisphaerales bacterium]|nr:hypothetical protein [Phycisphaerales bacterium]